MSHAAETDNDLAPPAFTICRRLAAPCCLLIACMHLTGCTAGSSPFLGIFAIPIPISAYTQDEREDRFREHERYARVPILGPITEGGPVAALDPPSDEEVMIAMERVHPVEGGVPLLYETQRNNVRIVKELIADYVDPVRVMPLVGPVQQHHAHYKCTVYYSEKVRVGWPIPHTLDDEDSVEVIYVDHNHLHMVGDCDTENFSPY